MKININRKGFQINGDFFFPFGFNYWPRDMAVYLWDEYDSKVIEREMNLIAELGANCIRIFIRWEDLNPKKDVINESFFPKFDDFLIHAKRNSIKVIPTLLIGHMSGQDWFPDWLIVDESEMEKGDINYQNIEMPPRGEKTGAIRDIYMDKKALKNSKLQLKSILERYKENTTILSYDLSNENQYWMEPVTPEIGAEYVHEMVAFMKSIDPNHPITYGMGKPDESSGFNSFGQNSFSGYLDYYAVHVYPEFLYPMSSEIVDFYVSYRVAYECTIAKISSIPVQLQEFGLSDMFFPLIDEDVRNKLIYGYFNMAFWDVILNETTAGVLTWDFCDFLPSLKERNPYAHKKFELYFGAVNHEYKIKPAGKAFQRFSNFIHEVDISKYAARSPKIAIVLPDNFNDFPRSERGESILRETTENHSKALFSSFLFVKMNHYNSEFISLNNFETNLNQYEVLILPNLYNLSDQSTARILKFLNSGTDRIVYFSSNNFLPDPIFGDINWETKRVRMKQIELSLTKKSLSSTFDSEIKLISIRSKINLKGPLKEIEPIYNQQDDGPITVFKSFSNNNKALFLCTAPEINHTNVRKAYQNESMVKLYRSLFEWAKLKSYLNCNNPLIETGILFDETEENAILIAINHQFSEQRCKIELSSSWSTITEYYGLDFNLINGKQLEFTINPYNNYTFILEK
jgi:endo-1,4-beta-mannosidase